MGYTLECYAADIAKIRDVPSERPGQPSSLEAITDVLWGCAPLMGTVHHASASGPALRDSLAVALGDEIAQWLLDRPELLGTWEMDTWEIGTAESVGGLRRDERGEAQRRLDTALDGTAHLGSDELGWLHQRRSVLRAVRAEGTDLVALYR